MLKVPKPSSYHEKHYKEIRHCVVESNLHPPTPNRVNIDYAYNL